ncbi:MAG: heavy metal translocating P-type ATPase [Albidovulum sp.]|nr:heavy metal translocating P-type ATPase [Albidovulum sp.]
MSESSATIAGAPRSGPIQNRIFLSLPGIHCGNCISAVESSLARFPGVLSARVNLTLRRVAVDADSTVSSRDLVEELSGVGIEALELDADTINASDLDEVGRALLLRVGVAGFAALNVMLFSIGIWSGAENATRELLHWVSALVALPALAYAAQPFLLAAFRALIVGRLSMDVPISVAIILAAGMSLYEVSAGGRHAYFDAALALTFFLLAGRFLDHRARASARSAALELAALEAPRARRIKMGKTEILQVGGIYPGDRILVLAGERIPVDGRVVEGSSEIDRSHLTGENMPATAGTDSVVSAGELNLTGALTIEAAAIGESTRLRKLARAVEIAETARNKYSSYANRAAAFYVPAVHILAVLAFAGWYWSEGDLRLALNVAIAVLIITCPCALGLAVPAVSTVAGGRLFSRNILLKSETALERLALIDTVVFDKTGTLTSGKFKFSDDGSVSRRDFAIAASLCAISQHPLSVSLVKAARDSGIEAARIADARESPGNGIEGRWRDQRVRFGRAEWVGASPNSGNCAFLKIGRESPIKFAYAESVRNDARNSINGFKARGIEVRILSGDLEEAVARVADQLGISNWAARVSPEQKMSEIFELAARGKRVLMVGDGLNDTGALASAHVSAAPASALDAARVASDIVVLGTNLEALNQGHGIARSARKRILENFGIAAAYNAIAIPLAMLGFATPLAAAIAMSASSLTVTFNSLRVR